MSKLVEALRAKLSAITGEVANSVDQETVDALNKAADDKAEIELKKKKEAIGDELGEQLTAPMVKTVDFEAYRTKVNDFCKDAMAHIEETQKVLDSLEDNINGVVKVSMDALLREVKSKTEVPAPKTNFDEVDNKEAQEEEKRIQELLKEQAKKRL